jgi:hypothetical protein
MEPQKERGEYSRLQHGSAAYAVLPPVYKVTPFPDCEIMEVCDDGVSI